MRSMKFEISKCVEHAIQISDSYAIQIEMKRKKFLLIFNAIVPKYKYVWQNLFGKTKRRSTFENRHIGRLMICYFTFSDAGYLSSNFPLFHFFLLFFFPLQITIFWIVQCFPVDSMDSADSYISLNHRREKKNFNVDAYFGGYRFGSF